MTDPVAPTNPAFRIPQTRCPCCNKPVALWVSKTQKCDHCGAKWDEMKRSIAVVRCPKCGTCTPADHPAGAPR